MRRRSRTSSKLAKGHTHKAGVQKRLNAPKVRGCATPDRETEVARLTRERDEALEQLSEALERQTATSEVLRVISSSSGILEPVFQAMLANAVRLCEAKSGLMCRSEGEALRAVALHGVPPSFAEERRRNPVIRPSPDSTLGRAVATKQTVQIADVQDEPTHVDSPSGTTGEPMPRLLSILAALGLGSPSPSSSRA